IALLCSAYLSKAMKFLTHSGKQRRQLSGLTLVEMMVASTLLLVILLGLMMMFNQTQRAFRTGLRNNDVMETGRAAMEIITRDVEQMVAAHRADATNAQVQLHSSVQPLRYTPPGGVEQAHFLQTFFFLQHNGNWEAKGYRVLASSIHTNGLHHTNGIIVGTLYSFSTNSAELDVHQFLRTFHGPTLTMVTNGTMRRLADGVVHFMVTMYDKNGNPFTTNNPPEVNVDSPFNGLLRVNLARGLTPTMVDLELGILEPQALEQLRPMIADGNEAAIRRYLTNNAGKVHIFRRQIPIRTAVR
ncbi:MAG: PilW family protein, partial [Limisphaerales bacterium]